MNRSQAHLSLLKVSLVVCAVLFAFFCVSILDSRPNASSVGAELVGDVVARVPAAIPGLIKEKHRPRAIGGFQVATIPCLGSLEKTDISTESTWIRFSSENCDKDDRVSEVELKNKTNGYVATLFTVSPGKMTSDFIPLLEGGNTFELNVKMDSGTSAIRHWNVDRHPTASN